MSLSCLLSEAHRSAPNSATELLFPEPFLLMCSKPDLPDPPVSGDAVEAKDAVKAPESKHSRDSISPKAEVQSAALHTRHLRSSSFQACAAALGMSPIRLPFHTCKA